MAEMKPVLFDEGLAVSAWAGKPLRILLTRDFEPRSSHRLADAVAREVTGYGYRPGGAPLDARLDRRPDGTMRLTARPVAWESSELRADGCVIFCPSENVAVYGVKFDRELASVNGRLLVEWNDDLVVEVVNSAA